MGKVLISQHGLARVQGMPLGDSESLNESDERLGLSSYAKAPGALADCYDASICSVVVAALANCDLSGLTKATGRTAFFMEIPETPAKGANPAIPQAVNQLAWQMANGAGGEGAFYFPEVLADLGSVYQSDDPRVYVGNTSIVITGDSGAMFRDFPTRGNATTPGTAHVTNEYVKLLMDNDFIVLLSFIWTEVGDPDPAQHRPSPSLNADGTIEMTPSYVDPSNPKEGVNGHKFVVSGYRDNAYPLLVNNIFDSGQQWIRLVPIAESTRPLVDADHTANNISKASRKLMPSSFYIEWEDPHFAVGQVNFIDHIDALSLNWPAPERVLTFQWGTGWTHFSPFVFKGVDHWIAYNSSTGLVHIDEIVAGGALTRWEWTWGSGWTHFVPFVWKGSPHVIIYNQETGAVHFDRIRDDLQGTDTLWAGTWGAGFTHFMPFTDPKHGPSFVAYNSDTGLVHFDHIRSSLHGSLTTFSHTWETGWSTLMPFVLDGAPHYLAYNSANCAVHIGRIKPGARSIQRRWESIWYPPWGDFAPWTDVVPVPYAGLPHYIAHDGDGHMHFGRINVNAQGAVVLASGAGPAGVSAAAPFSLDGAPHVMLYSGASGEVGYWTTPAL